MSLALTNEEELKRRGVLIYILGRFLNLPHVHSGYGVLVQRWYGDDAKFIAGNL